MVLRIAGGIAMLAMATTGASAQAYPDRNISVILPYSAGSGADFVARVTMPKLAQILKQNMIIENRAGSSGIAGTLTVAKAPPDGYTLLFSATQQVITPGLYKDLPYDMGAEFEPISRLTYHALPLAVSTTVPVNTLEELVAYVKANPGRLNYGSTGVGTALHLMGAYFVHLAGLQVAHVPYSKAADAVVGLGRGDIQFMFYSQTSLQPEIEAGRVKLLATSGAERAPWAKHLPAIKELYPEYVLYSWHGMFAPAKTPARIIETLNKGMAEVMRDPEVGERFAKSGASANHLGGDELKRFVAAEIELYRRIIQISGVQGR
jgi:tripartite-type tricarboxylate transporter receptor subunit TctC